MRIIGHDPVLPASHSGWAETRTELVPLEAIFARADALLRRQADAPAANAGDVVELLRLDRASS